MGQILNFTSLIAWQKAHELAISIYRVTQKFPREERYALVDQMRRCSISISSNIAEGFSRLTAKDKKQFYAIAKGSLTELQNQIIFSKDIAYINEADFNKLILSTYEVSKLITGIIRSAVSKV